MGEDVFLAVEAPSQMLLQLSSPNGVIGESSELASLILKLTFKDFDLFLTGDAQAAVLSEVASQNFNRIEVLQVQNHGSATGLNKGFADIITPQLVVISVGVKNRYGYPGREGFCVC